VKRTKLCALCPLYLPKLSTMNRTVSGGAVRRVVHLLLPIVLFALTGCDSTDLYPSGATQTITVAKSGRVTMSYTGSFRDTFDVVDSLLTESARRNPGERPESPSSVRAELTAELRRSLDGAGAKYRIGGDGTVRMERFELDDPRAWPSTVAYLVTVSERDEIVEINGDPEVLSATAEPAAATDSPQDADEALIRKFIADKVGPHFHGTLIVRTEGWVREHDADEVRQRGDGYTEYRWQIGYPPREPHMVIDNHAYSDAQRKLLTAEPGTSCMALIGAQCACGPFQLRTPFDEKPVANARYRITTDHETREGCTDANGKAPAILFDNVSRRCDFEVLPHECR